MGQSRNEDCLENMLGADNVLLPPMSRNEIWLHKILGEELDAPDPQSRIEELLKQIYEQGIGNDRFELTYKSQEFKVGDIIDDEALAEELIPYHCEKMLLLVASVNGNEVLIQYDPQVAFPQQHDAGTNSFVWTSSSFPLTINGIEYYPQNQFYAYMQKDTRAIARITITKYDSYTRERIIETITQGVTFHFEGYTNKFNQ